MDVFSRRGMFNQAIAGNAWPKWISTDDDPLFRFHRWLANLSHALREFDRSSPASEGESSPTPPKDTQLNIDDVLTAESRIRDKIHRTPVITSASINAMFGACVLFKCENFQRTGAFKARGAFNAVFSLSDREARQGVVTSSSGNQAAALALAARTRGIPAHIAMPKVALKSKVAAVQRYGGNIVWVEASGEVPTSKEYETTAARIQAETNATPIHPYNDLRTIAGQGTCALEFLGEHADLDLLLAPVGGGGLLAGTAVVAKAMGPGVRVFGCEPAMADDAQRSFRAGHIIEQVYPRTIADGLRTSLGDVTFPLIAKHVDDIVTVTEEGIVRAMRLLWEILKIVIEPSGAVSLAALLERRLPVENRTVGIILSGGNADLDRLPWTSPQSS